MRWDVFISHASEDKVSVARPLAHALENLGLHVWLDETELRVGDSLRARIDEGLAESRFGVVVLSPAFFAKRWPQRELAGLFARDVVLPVWHEVNAADVLRASPMLADIVATPTSIGMPKVAERILNAVAPYLDPSKVDSARSYSRDVDFPHEAVARAIDALARMADPETWPHFEITASGYPQKGWMGTDSDKCIETLYAFAGPLLSARAMSYGARRNFATMNRSARLRLALLDAALDVFFTEIALASIPPAIAYTPRVEDWRTKRLEDPQRYWWQGLSPDKFDRVRTLFLKPSTRPEEFELVDLDEFRETYRALYNAGNYSLRQQQAVGLLANGLYGFSPRNRPVLWRVMICQARLYQAALGNMEFVPERDHPRDVSRIFVPRDSSVFPFAEPEVDVQQLHESFGTTLAATSEYLRTFVSPHLMTALSVPQEP